MKDHRKARHWRAFSFFGLLVLGAGSALADGQALDCGPNGIDERAIVERVHDGDTLRLRDGRTVRLIGINAPELARRDGSTPAEAHAARAREALESLTPPGSKVDLDFDADREDRYGRLLAHIYLVQGQERDVQQMLLEQGHAFAIVVPPNAGKAACYRYAERRARERRAGLWALPDYEPVPADGLEPGASGFRLIRGRVDRVAETRGSWWLDLEGGTSLRILKADMLNFRDYPLAGLAGQMVEARGWLVPRRGGRPGSIMNLRHPAVLEIVPAPSEFTTTGAGDAGPAGDPFAEHRAIPDN
ncbi:MAG: thermonuclease family protein [Gammaproteobacteria bacterium]|jgi:endonuclease YncB( thermonuclease family)|nr:thermonuclease family protein [Gammaproteobacteria bacterium]